MEVENDLESLQRSADYLVVRKKLRHSAIGSLIFGVMAAAIGGLLIGDNLLNLLLVLIGLFLVGAGIFNLVKPTPEGIIVDGIALLIVGLYNIVFVCLLGLLAGGNPEDVKWGFIGLLQLYWAGRRFMDYPRYCEALREKPDPEELVAMEKLIRKINKSKDKEAGYIHFSGTGVVLKGMISTNAIIFVLMPKQEVVFAHKNDIALDIKGKVLIGSKLKGTLTVKKKHHVGTISANSRDKLEAWLDLEDVVELEPVEE